MALGVHQPSEAQRSVLWSRLPALDGVRGVAAIALVGANTPILLSGVSQHSAWRVLSPPGGWLGIDLFFALNGFLITGLLIDELDSIGRSHLGALHVRRGLRVLPGLLVLLSVHTFYVALVDQPMKRQLASAFWSLLFLENWHIALHLLDSAPDIGHLWALSIGGQFFIIWPALLIVLRRITRQRQWILPSFLWIAGGFMIINEAMMHGAIRASSFSYLVRSDTRPIALVFGAAAGLCWADRLIPAAAIVAAAPFAALICGLCLMFGSIERGYAILPIMGVAAPIVVWSIAEDAPLNRVFGWAPLRTIGRCSYCIYLWQPVVFWAVLRHGGAWPIAVRMLVGLAASAVCVTLSCVVVERTARPFRRGLVVQDDGSESSTPQVRPHLGLAVAPGDCPTADISLAPDVFSAELAPAPTRGFGETSFITSMLAHQRRELGLSIDDVAEQSGLSRQDVLAVDRDDPNSSFESLCRFGAVVGFDFELNISDPRD